MHSVILINENREEAVTLKEILRQEGYKVYVSYRINEGLIKVKDKKVDLMIINIDDSTANGFDIIREIRCNADYNSTYFVVVSNRCDDFDKVLALELGADDYLVKPVNQRELLARMKSILKYPKRIVSYMEYVVH